MNTKDNNFSMQLKDLMIDIICIMPESEFYYDYKDSTNIIELFIHIHNRITVEVTNKINDRT
jgi:hypothetical protein